jgi:type VI secretion system protein ImpJ
MTIPPIWSEGLFLRPQHFQAADSHARGNLHARLDGAAAYPWGIIDLELSDDLASGAQFGIKRLLAVLPDGEIIDIPGRQPPPPPFDITNEVRDEVIYLTLPARQPGAVEYAAADAADASTARYLIRVRDVIDATDPDRAAEPIETGEPNLRFGIEEADRAGRICLGLARIRELQARRVVFDDAYIPPSLDLRASQTLAGFIIDILGRLEQRQDEVSLRAAEPSAGTNSDAMFLLLIALNRWQPVLRHLARLDRVHPERLFASFLAFAGELATFTSAERRPQSFPDYDHENLELCFRPLIEALRLALGVQIGAGAQPLKLVKLAPGAYNSVITDRSLYDAGRFFLAVSAARPADMIRAQLPALVKIGSITRMEQLVNSAVPGVPLVPIGAPPSQIRPLPGYVYFELDRTSADWRDFATAPALGLHIAGDWPELQMELWCVKRPAR